MKSVNNELAFKSSFWYVISNVMVKGVVFVTTPVFTRLLSVEEFGTVSLFDSWCAILLPLFTLNLNYSIGRAKIDFKKDLDNYLASLEILSLCIATVWGCLFLIFEAAFSRVIKLNGWYFRLLICYLIFQPIIVLCQNYYRYRYEYKKLISISWILVVANILISLSLILCFDGNNAIFRMLGIVIPTVFTALFLFLKTVLCTKFHSCLSYWKYGVSISLPLVIHTLSLYILAQSDRVIIRGVYGENQVALYSLAYSYGMILSVVTNAISDGWLPWFHDNYDLNNYFAIRTGQKRLTKLGLEISILAALLGPEAIRVLGGEKYTESIYCIPPIVYGILFQYIYTHYVNIELHKKKTLFVSTGTVIAAIINIILNYIFIPIYGYYAAAYTTLMCYILLWLIHLFITKALLGVQIYDDIFLLCCMLFVIVLIPVTLYMYKYKYIRYAAILMLFIVTFFRLLKIIRAKRL